MDSTDDTYLVARAREGHPDAYEELVRRHQHRAYTLAVRMLGDRHEAQDVVQESFVEAWRALPSFAGQASFSTWLHRIVVHRCLNSQRRRRPVPAPEDTAAASPVRTEQVVEDRHRDAALHRALGALPELQRAPLVLTTFLGSSYEEAGEILGLPASTVRGRVARARRALLTSMREWA